MNNVTQVNPGFVHNKWSQATDKIADAKDYITSHKASCIATLAALSAIAYLVNENQSLATKNTVLQNALDNRAKPNQWTLQGNLNPITRAFTDTTICQQILAAASDNISDPVTNLHYKNGHIDLTYQFAFSGAHLSPLQLLIHNNCQESVRAYRSEILDPDFSLDKLKNSIVAAAAAQNKPLWDELMSALTQNNHAQNEQVKHLVEIFKKSKAALDIVPSNPNTSDAYYGTVYDVAISLEETHTRQIFLLQMFNSPFMKTVIEKTLSEINEKLSDDKISQSDLNHLAMNYASFIVLNSAPNLMSSYEPSFDLTRYPNLQKYVNQKWQIIKAD